MSLLVQSDIEEVLRMREKIYDAIMCHVPPQILEGALLCKVRFLDSLPHRHLSENKIFVAYGGGKDSSYMVAFVRLIQLLIFREYATTFRLRVVTNRHSGMPRAVLENIDRTFKSLGLHDDPDVELLLVDGNEIHPFNVKSPLPESVRERNRLDILMTGHRCEGEARPTFCNACNLSMVNSFEIAISYDGGVDVVITGDSSKELRTYIAWMRQIARKLGLPELRDNRSFSSFLRTMENINHHYFKDIYGERLKEELQLRRFRAATLACDPVFFSIYHDTPYRVEDHWELLTNFLGFQFDEVAFSFTESDCGNPALMAHLRGLKVEHLYDRTYEEGIAEYVRFATALMQKKDFPVHLIEVIGARYATSESIKAMRDKMNQYAKEVFDLSEEQLVCMLYSPFAQRGKNLHRYLSREKPELCRYLERIHHLLECAANRVEEQQALERQLVEITHLGIEHLCTIYSMDLSLQGGVSSATPIALILSKDPHKAVINMSYRPDGPIISEVISGR